MKRKIIILILIILLFVMIVGFAVFSQIIKINGTANITSNWKILFTKIEDISKTSGVTIKQEPTASGTTATFNVDLKNPGDKIVYQITVENQGTLDAIIEDITAKQTQNKVINFEISDIEIGDELSAGDSTTFNVSISYDDTITTQPEVTSNSLTISIDYVQNKGQEVMPDLPSIETPVLLSEKILDHNNIQSDSDIDFGWISEEGNGTGLYYTNTNTEGNGTTYYFRGDVKNNWVKFGNEGSNEMYWRIIRINEDGSIRLIYQGNRANKQKSIIGSSAFNSLSSDNAYAGYMFGSHSQTGENAYKLTHSNNNSSSIKNYLENWFINETNLSNYSNYLADAGFCNDRSIYFSNTGISKVRTYYNAADRLENLFYPQFACNNVSNDLFTLENSTKGNGTLNIPVGLITVDEVVYAGGVAWEMNEDFYLNCGLYYWTMSPSDFYQSDINIYNIGEYGDIGIDKASRKDRSGVRPVINLVSNIEIIDGGMGTETNPYEIKLN